MCFIIDFMYSQMLEKMFFTFCQLVIISVAPVAITAIRAPIGLLTTIDRSPVTIAGMADDSNGKAVVAKLKVAAFKTLSPVITAGIAYVDRTENVAIAFAAKL